MANNQAIVDAVISGAGGGAQTAWLASSDPNVYNTFTVSVNAIANAVDALIPPIIPGPSLSQLLLLQSITNAVFQGRYPTDPTSGTWSDIATRIVVLYTKLEVGLGNIPDLYAPGPVGPAGPPGPAGPAVAISGASVDVALPIDGATVVLAQVITGLAPSKYYVATIGIRVSVWPTAALTQASQFDCLVTAVASTDGAGVATVTFLTTPYFYLSLAHTNMRTTICTTAASAGGYTISVTRPTGVACKAKANWWIADTWLEVTP